jgi:hypothetical protein
MASGDGLRGLIIRMKVTEETEFKKLHSVLSVGSCSSAPGFTRMQRLSFIRNADDEDRLNDLVCIYGASEFRVKIWANTVLFVRDFFGLPRRSRST